MANDNHTNLEIINCFAFKVELWLGRICRIDWEIGKSPSGAIQTQPQRGRNYTKGPYWSANITCFIIGDFSLAVRSRPTLITFSKGNTRYLLFYFHILKCRNAVLLDWNTFKQYILWRKTKTILQYFWRSTKFILKIILLLFSTKVKLPLYFKKQTYKICCAFTCIQRHLLKYLLNEPKREVMRIGSVFKLKIDPSGSLLTPLVFSGLNVCVFYHLAYLFFKF